MTDKENLLVQLYKKLNIGKSDVCLSCHKENPELTKPVTAWFVGEHFDIQSPKILFVGKTARGVPRDEVDGVIQAFDMSRDGLWFTNWPYWSYTRAICQEIFGSDDLENIAFTNMVKCNSSPTIDTTSELMKQNCICNLKVIQKEVELIKPELIIAYTGYAYDQSWKSVFDAFDVQCDEKRKIGEKMMPWLEAQVMLNGQKMNFLRLGHPERMKKVDYVHNVCSWITDCSKKK